MGSAAALARRTGECVWEIPPDARPDMRVPARIYASEPLLAGMDQGVFDQITNVACLPGIVRAAMCMPDGHWGYGFPIGGVAAFRADTGVISPAASASTSTAACG
jgi:tRNA-splicing ligase RtcB